MQAKTTEARYNNQNSAVMLDLAAWLKTHAHTLHNLTPETLPQLSAQQICTDTRQLQKGDVYLPLRGDSFDGHQFLRSAYEQGLALLFCEQAYFEAQTENLKDLPLICVPNSLQAYQSLARFWRRQLGIPVVAITGSSGKTSTKEILAQVLAPFFQVHRTEANFNNEIGVPKTLLSLRPEHEVAIVEMGMRGLGQIAELCQIAEPSHGIITNIGPVHLGELGSQENIAKAKWELAEALEKTQGTLAINIENPWLKQLSQNFASQLLDCGAQGQVQLCESQRTETGQIIAYRLPGDTQTRQIHLDLEGQHQALNLLCCLGILFALGHTLTDQDRIQVPRLFGRQQEQVIHGITLIHDAYNANPDSMKAALQVLAQRPGRRIAVLGLMGELGPDAPRFHREVGQVCESLKLDKVYTVGSDAAEILNGLQQVSGQGFASKSEASSSIAQTLQAGDQVLFKASRSAGLEEVIDTVATQLAQLAP